MPALVPVDGDSMGITTTMTGPKIIIVRGHAGAVAEWAHRSCPDEATTFELDTSAAARPIPWRAGRRLLRELARRRGEAATEEAVEPERPFSSTILRPLQARLTPAESRRRIHNSGGMLGRLPMAGSLTVGPIGAAIAKTLAALLGERPVRLLVACASELDSESWGMLAPLLSAHPDLTLIIGRDPAYVPACPIQARVAEVGDWELSVLGSLRHATIQRYEVEGRGAAESPSSASRSSASEAAEESYGLDDELERRAYDLLDSEGALSDRELQTVRAAIDGAFDALGFPAVVCLGQRLLARRSEFDGADEVRLLAGVSALNLCAFATRAAVDHPLNVFGDEQLDYLLGRELDPADRVFLMYRRGMRSTGSREGLATAGELLSCAVQEARALPGHCVLHRVYSHNGAAYVNYRLGQRESAREHCKAALVEAQAGHPDAPEAEVASAHFNVLVNLARLAFMDGDVQTAKAQMLEAHTRLHEIPTRKAFFSWFSTEIFLDDMAATVDEFERTLATLEPYWVETAIAPYAFWAGDLHYRLGNGGRAYERFDLAVQLWSHFHEDPNDVFYVHLNCAVAALRAEQYETAHARFRVALEALSPEQSALRAEIQAALANVAARRGQGEGASTAIAETMRILESVDSAEVRARVLRVLGDTFVLLDQPEAARESFEAGLALAAATSGGAAPLDRGELPPEDMLGLLLGLVDVGQGSPLVARRAFELATEALSDSDAWWDMPRLVGLLSRSAWRAAVESSDVDLPGLLSLVKQRPDCAQSVAALESRLAS